MGLFDRLPDKDISFDDDKIAESKRSLDDMLSAAPAPPAADKMGFIESNLSKGTAVAEQALGGALRFAGAERLGNTAIDLAKKRQQELELADPSTQWKDVDGLASGAKFVGETVLKTAPIAAGTVVGGLAGAMAAPVLGVTGVGATALAAAGAFLPSMAVETGLISSETDRVDGNRGHILGAAAPAAALDALPAVAGMKMTGVTNIARNFARGAMGQAIERGVPKAGLATRVAQGAGALAAGTVGEAGTESAQTPLEAWGAKRQVFQDGKQYSDDIAKNTLGAFTGGMAGGENYTPQMKDEMKESFFAGGAAGLGMSGAGKAISSIAGSERDTLVNGVPSAYPTVSPNTVGSAAPPLSAEQDAGVASSSAPAASEPSNNEAAPVATVTEPALPTVGGVTIDPSAGVLQRSLSPIADAPVSSQQSMMSSETPSSGMYNLPDTQFNALSAGNAPSADFQVQGEQLDRMNPQSLTAGSGEYALNRQPSTAPADSQQSGVPAAPPNSILTQVADLHGDVIDYIATPHDGTPEGMHRAAIENARKLNDYEGASNNETIHLVIGADGQPTNTINARFGDLYPLPNVQPTGVPSMQTVTPPVEAAPGVAKHRTLNEYGEVTDGVGIKPKEQFSTSSGRVTTPFPHQKGEKYATQWLIENAVAEAEARGDRLNAGIFKDEKLLKRGDLPPASKDGMTMYLFGRQPEVIPSILKPLVPAQPTGVPEVQAASSNQTLATAPEESKPLQPANMSYAPGKEADARQQAPARPKVDIEEQFNKEFTAKYLQGGIEASRAEDMVDDYAADIVIQQALDMGEDEAADYFSDLAEGIKARAKKVQKGKTEKTAVPAKPERSTVEVKGEEDNAKVNTTERIPRSSREGLEGSAADVLEGLHGSEYGARTIGSENRQDVTQRESKALIEWAKSAGHYLDNDTFTDAYVAQFKATGTALSGGEHDVVMQGKFVRKRNNLPEEYHHDYQELFHRVARWNEQFPSSALRLIGIAEENGIARPIFRQKAIKGRDASLYEVDTFLTEVAKLEPIIIRGATVGYRKAGTSIIYTDTFGGNTKVDVAGNIVPIDYVIYEGARAEEWLKNIEENGLEVLKKRHEKWVDGQADLGNIDQDIDNLDFDAGFGPAPIAPASPDYKGLVFTASLAGKRGAAEIFKPVLNQSRMATLQDVLNGMDGKERGGRIAVDVDGMGGSWEWSGYSSSFPEWFKNKGYSSKDIKADIQRLFAGGGLTRIQLNRLDTIAQEIRRENVNYLLAGRKAAQTEAAVFYDEAVSTPVPEDFDELFEYLSTGKTGSGSAEEIVGSDSPAASEGNVEEGQASVQPPAGQDQAAKPLSEVVSSSGEVQNKLFATPPAFGKKPQPKSGSSTNDLKSGFGLAPTDAATQGDIFAAVPVINGDAQQDGKGKGKGKGKFSIESQHDREYAGIEAKYFNPDGTEKSGAMLAPNGKRSNLNKRQWIHVRTASFKKWFGDWEIPAQNLKPASTFKEARDVAKAYAGITLQSMDGIKATVSRNNLDKMLSVSAVHKSETIEEHALAVANLDKLFESAVLGWSKSDRADDSNISAVHRLFSVMNVKGTARLVKLTVKEFAQEGQGNKIYSVESVHVQDKSPVPEMVDADRTNGSRLLTGPTELIYSIVKNIQDYNNNSVPKVVDDNGEPLVVYHGGRISNKFGEWTGAGGKKIHAVWITEDLGAAQTYADRYRPGESEIKPMMTVIKNPLDLRDRETAKAFFGEDITEGAYSSERANMSGNIPKENIEMLIKAEAMGHDGIIHYDTDAYGRGSDVTYIALGENKVKLATTDDGTQYYDSTIRQDGNIGAFDGSNPDIRYSINTTTTGTKASDIKAAFKGHPLESKIIVTQSQNEWPLSDADRFSLKGQRASGMYQDGKIYLAADNLESVDRALAVALGHELSHAGQTDKLTGMAVAWFRNMYDNPTTRNEFEKKAAISLMMEANKRGLNLKNSNDFRAAVQEASSVMAESLYTNGVKSPLLNRMLVYIKHFLRNKLGWKSIPYTDKEIAATVSEMMRVGQKNLGKGAAKFSLAGVKDKGYNVDNKQEGGKYEDVSRPDPESTEAHGQRSSDVLASIKRGREVDAAPVADTNKIRVFDPIIAKATAKDALAAAEASEIDDALMIPLTSGAKFSIADSGKSSLYGYDNDRSTFDERAQIPGYFRDYFERGTGSIEYLFGQLGMPITSEEADTLRTAGAGKNIYAATAGSDVAPVELKYPYRYKPTYSASLKSYTVPDGVPSGLDPNHRLALDDAYNRLKDAFTQASNTPYFSLSSDTMQYGKEFFANNKPADLLKGLGSVLSPDILQRIARSANAAFPKTMDAIGAIFNVPVFQGERDAAKRKAGEVSINDLVETGIKRAENNMEFQLEIMGWDGPAAQKPSFLQRVKEDVTQWDTSDTTTKWGRIQKAVNKNLNDQQRAALDIMQREGDVNNTAYPNLATAMKNKRIAAAKPDKAVFDAYKQVRDFIDNDMVAAREKLTIKLGEAIGADKELVAQTIKAFRAHIGKWKGWMPRKHGEGQHQVNVYHTIKELPFTTQAVEDGHQATMPYYAGKDVAREIRAFAREYGLLVSKNNLGAPTVTASNKTQEKVAKDIEKWEKELAETNIAEEQEALQVKLETLNRKLELVSRPSDERIAEFIEASKEFLGNIRSQYETNLTELRDQLDKAKQDGAHKGEIRKIKNEIEKLGDGTVKVKLYMRLHESEAQAQKHKSEVVADLKGKLDHVYHAGEEYATTYKQTSPVSEGLFGDMAGDFAAENIIKEAIEKAQQTGKMGAEEAEAVRTELFRSYANVMLSRGAGRHQILRAPYLIQGYDQTDTTQLYHDYMTSVAGMLSKAMYAKQQFDNYRYVPADIRVWAEKYIKNTLRNMDHKDRIGANVRAVATFMYLGFKISSILVNGTQTWTLGVAELGRRTRQNSVKAILKAQMDIIKDHLSADEQRLFNDQLWKEQEMATVIHEMSGQNEGSTGKVSRFMHTLVGKSLLPFQEMEMLNRRTMVLAAYRSFMADGVSREDAIKQAMDVNRKTNFDSSRANLPQWAHHPVGRTAYALQSFVWNNWSWIYNRATSGEKADLLALLKYAGMISAIGGVTALAGGDEANKIIRRLTGKDYKLAMEVWARQHAKEYGTAGELMNAAVWHGGMGALGINISNAMRLNVPMSGFITGDTTAGESAMGIWSGLYDKGENTIKYASRGQVGKALESAAPAAIEAPLKAYRMATQGATTSHGKPIFDENGLPLKYSATEAVARAVGLQPLEQSFRAEVARSERKLTSYWSEKRGTLLDEIRVATGDRRKDVVKKIVKFNKDVRKSQAWPLVNVISADTIRKSAAASRPNKKKQAWGRQQLAN